MEQPSYMAIYMVNPLKRQEKMHLKNEVCWSRLLQIIT